MGKLMREESLWCIEDHILKEISVAQSCCFIARLILDVRLIFQH